MVCTAPPFLYRAGHVPGAVLARADDLPVGDRRADSLGAAAPALVQHRDLLRVLPDGAVPERPPGLQGAEGPRLHARSRADPAGQLRHRLGEPRISDREVGARRTDALEAPWLSNASCGRFTGAGCTSPASSATTPSRWTTRWTRAPRGEGPKPMEMLLASLASCAGGSVVALLRRGGHQFEALTVTARGQRRSEHPTIFTEIALEFAFRGTARSRGRRPGDQPRPRRACVPCGRC
ncbi:MAG: OsmC family protein [Desulfomicrobium escambiense]|nr:OsmC family protein [Desulfomicrobium escambiense]